jgi:hypothetical protein
LEEAAERRRDELRAGFSARDKHGLQAAFEDSGALKPLMLGSQLAFGGRHEHGASGPPKAAPLAITANVTRWQASLESGARVYDALG